MFQASVGPLLCLLIASLALLVLNLPWKVEAIQLRSTTNLKGWFAQSLRPQPPSSAQQLLRSRHRTASAIKASIAESNGKCSCCNGLKAMKCNVCTGSGIDKINGNVFERWTCTKCKGFGLIPCKVCSPESKGLTPEQTGER